MSSSSAAVKPAAPKAAPDVHIVKEEHISVASSTIPLTYDEACAKIRDCSDSFSFNVGGGGMGRVDVVSLATKFPAEDRWDVGTVSAEDCDTIYVGIYDGHNGMETSEVLSKSLIPYVASALASLPADSDSVTKETAIEQAFVRLDERILDTAEAALAAGYPAGAAELRTLTGPAFGGSCALLLAYESNSSALRIALTGDSRAVRGQYSPGLDAHVVDVLTKDQNVNNEEEYARIAAEHPGEASDIMDTDRGDLLDIATTRAFGNHRWKWPREVVMKARSSCHSPRPLAKPRTPPYMTARPEVTTRVVHSRDFVILGSDGFWEAISNEDAVECVARWAAAKRAGRPEEVVESKESRYDWNEGGQLSRTARREDFAIEDLDNVAVCLLKNVLGGRHRYMVAGAVTATAPISRMVRDDITVQVVFLQDFSKK